MESKIHLTTMRLNIMDEQFLDALRPLIFTQNFLLFPKFIITERNIAILKKSCTRSFVGLVLFLLMRLYRAVCCIHIFEIYIGITSVIIIIMNTCIGFVGTICSYIGNIAQSQDAILILMELQYTLRSINLDKRHLLAHQKLWNFINVACLFTGYVIYTILIAITHQELYSGGSFLVSYVVSIIFDLNMILATRTVGMLHSILASWNRKMFSQLPIVSAEYEDENCTKEMFFSYKRMIKAFIVCENVYQFAIFFHTCQTFHHALYSVQLLLEYAKLVTIDNFKIFGLLRTVVYFAWNCKNFTLLINLSVACERFYARVRDVETACVLVVAASEDSDLRKTCKNVLRLNRALLRRLSAFGLFSVDAAFPLRLIGALVAYIVVLLQFALL